MNMFDELKMLLNNDEGGYFEIIDKELGHLIIQMLRYSWGIHIGVMTSRYEYKRVRKN